MLNAFARTLRFYRRLGANRRGAIAIEFATIMPVMATMLVGTYDLSEVWVVERRVTTASTEIAEIATNLAIQADDTNQINSTSLAQARSAFFAYFPTWMNDTSKTFTLTVSSVAMVGTPAGCSGSGCTGYVAQTAWTNGSSQNEPATQGRKLANDATQRRPCGLLAPASATKNVPSVSPNALQLATLPDGIYGTSALIVVDVSAVYQPLFLGFLTGPVSFLRSTYMPPRIGDNTQYVTFSATAQDGTLKCPGYS